MKLNRHHIELLATRAGEQGADMLYDEVMPQEFKEEWVNCVGGQTSGESMAETAYERIYEAVEAALTDLEVC